jgi:hypothetical protein
MGMGGFLYRGHVVGLVLDLRESENLRLPWGGWRRLFLGSRCFLCLLGFRCRGRLEVRLAGGCLLGGRQRQVFAYSALPVSCLFWWPFWRLLGFIIIIVKIRGQIWVDCRWW